MNKPGAAWEWRLFGAGREAPVIPGLTGQPEERSEFDHYLVAPEVKHNVKLRAGDVEVKRLLETRARGLQLWQDKEIFSLPASAGQVAALGKFLNVNVEGADVQTAEELIAYFTRFQPALRTVHVTKRRVRWHLAEGCRLELAHICIGEQAEYWSYCADSYDVAPLITLVESLPVPPDSFTMSYVELLQAAHGDGKGLAEGARAGRTVLGLR